MDRFLPILRAPGAGYGAQANGVPVPLKGSLLAPVCSPANDPLSDEQSFVQIQMQVESDMHDSHRHAPPRDRFPAPPQQYTRLPSRHTLFWRRKADEYANGLQKKPVEDVQQRSRHHREMQQDPRYILLDDD